MKAGEKLKLYLDKRGFNQSAVAAGIGMNVKTFNAALNGHTELKVDTLLDVLRFTGTKPEKFFSKNFLESRSTA